MRHYPIFLSLSGARVVVAGGGEIALAKLRLLMKTEADIHVYAPEAREEIAGWAEAGKPVPRCRRGATGLRGDGDRCRE